MDYCIIDLGSVFVVLKSPKSHVWSAFELVSPYCPVMTYSPPWIWHRYCRHCLCWNKVLGAAWWCHVCTNCLATSSSSERCRKQRYSLCRHGFTTLCKGLHQTLVWREGGKEANGWVENWVRRREHALLGDHQTGCRVKADQRKVLSFQSFAYT